MRERPLPPRESDRDGVYRGHPSRQSALPGTTAILAAVLVQFVGLIALFFVFAFSHVLVNHGAGGSCYWIDYRTENLPHAIVHAIAYGNLPIEQSWAWAPPGLLCRVSVSGRMVTVHAPAWREMAWPLLAPGACLVLTPALTVYARRRRRPALWAPDRAIVKTAAIAVFQPLTLATVFVAVGLPAAVN